MLWDGMKSIWDSITGWIDDSINWIEDKVKFWKKEAKKVKAAKRAAEDDDDEPDGSHRNGLDYVPMMDIERSCIKEKEFLRQKKMLTMERVEILITSTVQKH